MPTPQIYRFAIISKTDTNLNSNLQKGIDMRKLLCVLLIFAFPTIICADEVDDAIRDAIGAAPPAIAEPEVTEPEITEPEVTIPQPSKKEKIKGELAQYPITAVQYPSPRNWNGHGWGRGGHGWYGDYHHASTAAEGYLSGYGRLYRGYGHYLVSRGMYMNLYQDAYHKSIVNHRDAVHTWWQLKDEYKERFRRDHPTWPVRELRRFDMAKQVYEVKQIEKDLTLRGILAPRPPSSFTYDGKTYASYAEFKKSPEWAKMKAEAKKRQPKPVAPAPPAKKKFEQVW
jgi:hypothetical protein